MILTYEFKDGAYLEEDSIVKFWLGFGLHDFEGDWEGFANCYPDHMRHLLKVGFVIFCLYGLASKTNFLVLYLVA